jgi:hypothetical protein
VKPEVESMEGEKSENGKGKLGEEVKDEAKLAEEERMTAVWEKQENKEEKSMGREESKIEKNNLAEGEKQEEEEIEDIMEVKEEGEQEKGKLFNFSVIK